MRKRAMAGAGLVVLLAIVAAACSKSNPPAAGGTMTTLTSGTLTVGSCLDYKPFESVPPGGQPTGFDVKMVDAVAAKLGLQVKWVKANFNTIFTAVNQGKFDMVAAAVTATGTVGNKRAQTVDFSDYYYNSEQGFTVNTGKTPDITTTDDLKSGDVVGVQSGTTGEEWAKENLVPKGIQIKSYVAAPQAFTDLEAGNITGVINDAPSSAAEVASRPNLKVVEQIDTNEKYAFAFPKGATENLTLWNAAFKQVVQDGTYTTIFQKYFPGVPVPPEYQPS